MFIVVSDLRHTFKLSIQQLTLVWRQIKWFVGLKHVSDVRVLGLPDEVPEPDEGIRLFGVLFDARMPAPTDQIDRR